MSEESKILDLKSVEAIRDWVKDNFVTKTELLKLGLTSQLYVTFDEDFVGQTYSIVGGDKTYSGVVPENKEVIVLVNAPNTAYTVTCPNDEGTECTCKIQVGSQNGRYAGKLECFKAYLHVQAEAGAAVTATVGDYSYTGTAGEDGYCTLTVKRKGTYSVIAKLGTKSSDAATADVSESSTTVEVVCGELKMKIVNWSDGSDEEVAAMIDAAHAGTIDLQTDMGWKVGDTRTIHVEPFEGDQSHGNEDLDIVISSFEDYENCGCKMQFDFKRCCRNSERMYQYNDSDGGYRTTYAFLTTLPNMVSALPEWLSNRLIEFSVKAYSRTNGNAVETIENIKLGLRSEIEVFGTATLSAPGEGEQIEYYKNEENRVKSQQVWNRNSMEYKLDEEADWWLRSPAFNDGRMYCYVYSHEPTECSKGYAPNSNGIAPFGCL